MKTLALKNGDLVVESGGHKTVSGSTKVAQELYLSLGEPYGSDRFHRDLGSVLDDFFGQPINDMTEAMVEAEVIRVVRSYIETQRLQVLEDHLESRQSRFDASDVVAEISHIDVTVDYDKILVKLALRTATGSQVAITRTVQP
ncbi:hypothetical protein [Dermacoccus nishinomiyaensis]|uniref:hypothetical protein n=1 Tax=Dermacoccus nishinomiyaensis TaxID=1274 RepID=UPI00248D54AF|nr:hypothetical protein [Dermacoccus nishinomiyaensis]